jgi:hypothetical protein
MLFDIGMRITNRSACKKDFNILQRDFNDLKVVIFLNVVIKNVIVQAFEFYR